MLQSYSIIAHRGLFSLKEAIAENSLQAFRLAIKNNYAIELDVHLTKDNKLVVFHDDNLKRMTGVDKLVEQCDLSFLQTLSLSETKEHIPSLDEVLSLVKGTVPLLIEIKSKGNIGTLERQLMITLANYQGEYAIESFHPLSLYFLKKHYPHVIRGQLSEKHLDTIKNPLLNWILSKMLLNIFTKPHFIAYNINDITQKMSDKYRKKQLPLLGWTIRNKQQYTKAKKLVDGIIFDNVEIKR